MRDFPAWFWAMVASFVALFIFIIFWAIPQSVHEQREWERNCVANGGHVDSRTETHTGVIVDSKGKPSTVTTTETTYYCFGPDGGIRGIR